VTPYYADGTTTIFQGDALELLPQLPAASVHLILTDPPYGNVKTAYLGEKLTWDRQWKTPAAYLAWLRQMALEWQRVLVPNGSVYCFASPQMAAPVEVMLGEVFQVLNQLVWRKHDGSGAGTGGHSKICKEDLLSYFPQTERIVFCEQYGSKYEEASQSLHKQVFAPLGRYIQEERERAGLSQNDVDVGLGYIEKKHPERGSRLIQRWEEGSSLPTKETYERLRAFLNTHGRQEYSYLRQEYEDLRQEYEDLRRPFFATKGRPYTDILDYATVATGPDKHPCEKPLPLLRDLILTSSRPGTVVLDSCAGSCATLEAARDCGRVSIGMELDARWCRRGRERLAQQVLWQEVS
jgi:adenine-specific DNA-methyltransferase